MSCCVYYHEDAAGDCLYIGCAKSPDARFYNHTRTSSWARDVANIRVTWFDTREDALAFEASEIKRVKPPHNDAWKPRQKKRWYPNQGHVFLSSWMSKNGVTAYQFADLLGVSVKEAKRLAHGVVQVRIPKAKRIARLTGGFVPTWAWHRDYPDLRNAPFIRYLTEAEADDHIRKLDRYGATP